MSSSAVSSTSSISRRSHRSPQPISNSPSPAPPSVASTLDILIGHLLASKRSLNAVTHLHRASAIIAESRSILESTAIVSARSSFLQRSLQTQVHTLESVHSQLTSLILQAQTDFSTLLKDLDKADAELEATIKGLRGTNVERAFRPGEDVQKTLLDFVDEKPVGEIREGLRMALDNLNAVLKTLEDAVQDYDIEISSIKQILFERTSQEKGDSIEAPKTAESSWTSLLHRMEDHAKEMAIGLESLVKHFDLCVTAIKHTEGGGAAAQNLAGDLPEGLGVGDRDFEVPTEPITEDERAEMLTVLHNDASEVEEVVMEIQDRIADMELQLERILELRQKAVETSSNAHLAFRKLEEAGAQLPSRIARAQGFQMTWAEEKAKIDEGMSALEDLRDVYDNFLAAYDGLIVEVARRKAIKVNMDKIIQEAHGQLEKLFDDDMAQREAFRQDQGDYLPSDIWPGLADPPVRYAFTRTDDSGGSIPDLPRRTVEEAYRRLQSSQHTR